MLSLWIFVKGGLCLAQKIYLTEDDERIVELMSKALVNWGFVVQATEDFQRVTEDIRAFEPDLVLLDITLPFYNGFYWCQEIRKFSTVPIIFISSADENMNMVMAMNMGADDFIGKPFDLQVLVAKIQALLRRTYTFAVEEASLEFQGYVLDVEDSSLRFQEEVVPLTKNETKILHLLFKNPNQLVSKEKIMEKLWEDENFIDSNTLSVNMTRLRKKLLEIGFSRFIHTLKGKGYYLDEENK
jgi:DNA-binding response OmpR family regulator